MRQMLTKLAPERRVAPGAMRLAAERHYRLNEKIMASLVGLVAILLPVFLWLWPKATGECMRDSISHFYYSAFPGTVFVAALAFIGAFLIAYRGDRLMENVLASIAGVAAIAVALFPTSQHGCDDGRGFTGRPLMSFDGGAALVIDEASGGPLPRFELFGADAFRFVPAAEVFHYVSAIVLFLFLLWYALRIFPAKSTGEQTDGTGRITRTKATRNMIYYATALVIAVAAGLMLAQFVMKDVMRGDGFAWWKPKDGMFWCEFAALVAFGVGWVVKGRLFNLVLKDERD
ncbi:hypothetical protein [Pseudoroseicyclus sp. CXY001]|uniref:hypothetical protein n=1 Tax=Pseudoroseicyclus sp. CXY001 TaxID=3242492 RepID=UPI003570BC8D